MGSANGHISATGDLIHIMFGSRVGFSGSTDRMALFPVTSNPYLRNDLFDPLIHCESKKTVPLLFLL